MGTKIVILKSGKMRRTTLDRTPPVQTSAPHQQEDVGPTKPDLKYTRSTNDKRESKKEHSPWGLCVNLSGVGSSSSSLSEPGSTFLSQNSPIVVPKRSRTNSISKFN
ncbi:hypothetical protein AVEN_159080-1 [Araneus ventricosus]|uniref:Uncharacterized protein n=1 Tax=Araneus ventricosus TaxID=182803 RepID=A0A4Y2B825_ARAVE|nr:hypothetical protein AVEN_159080-1 [Araneus ventricosus]